MSRTDDMNPPPPHEILQTAIEKKFDDLKDQIIKYENTNTVEDWDSCIQLLPQIADLVCCLKQEADIAEGKHPLN